MRLIDADELRKEIDKQAYPYKDSTANDIYFSVLHLLVNAPTVDSESIKYGKWIEGADGSCMCSECGKVIRYTIGYYCPNCGAKMEGGYIWLT